MIYCPYGNIANFWHTSRIRFSVMNELKHAIQTIGRENLPKPLPTPGEYGFPSNTPNSSSITLCTFTQLCNKVLIGYNGMPHIHLRIAPSCMAIATPIYLPHPWTQHIHHTKWHPDQISLFLQHTGHTHRQTDRLTDRISNKTCTNTSLHSIDYCNAANNNNILKTHLKPGSAN